MEVRKYGELFSVTEVSPAGWEVTWHLHRRNGVWFVANIDRHLVVKPTGRLGRRLIAAVEAHVTQITASQMDTTL